VVLEVDNVDYHQHPGIDVQKEEIVKKGIAFFDFDGTITTRDTLLEFIKFTKGKPAFYGGFLYNIFYLLAYKIKLISNQSAKEKVLSYFFKNTGVKDFEKLTVDFSKNKLPSLLRPGAEKEISRLQNDNFVVVIVSASPENWIRHWCKERNLILIATELEIIDGRISGKISGKNCHGQEKVRRILEKYTVEEYDEIYVYGDTKGDLPMLGLATKPFYKPFL
jgi:phosphatidylglycerophosphatase C